MAEIAAAVERALAAAAADREEVAYAVFSLAGADWPEDKADLHAALAPLVPTARVVLVVNDAIGALRAGAKDGVGLSVVCGTGGCVGARGPDGREWHSSWWALHTGGWAIGADALDAVYRAELGIGPRTSLGERALRVFAAASVEEVLHQFTKRGGRGAFETSKLAPAVLEEALAGDAVAHSIVVEHGAKLGDVAAAAARLVGLTEAAYPVVLLGGVLRGTGAELLVREILTRLPGAVPTPTRFEPVAGALLMAYDAARIPIDEDRLHETFPQTELFATQE